MNHMKKVVCCEKFSFNYTDEPDTVVEGGGMGPENVLDGKSRRVNDNGNRVNWMSLSLGHIPIVLK